MTVDPRETTQSEFINGLLLRCFGDFNELTVTEGDLHDALVEMSTMGCLYLRTPLARAVLVSGAIRRVEQLRIVAHPEQMVRVAMRDMMDVMRDARTPSEGEEAAA